MREIDLTKKDYKMLIEEANVRKHKYAIQGRFAESAKLQDVQVELIKEYAILGL